MLIINAKIQIPEEELEWTYSRSSGPGGQNVNKVNSKATVRWNVRKSEALPADVRDRFLNAYGSRITNEGELLVTSQESRDQPKNIDICREKLAGMIRSVLAAPKKRRPTKPTKGSQFRRVEAKKRRSAIKQGRRSAGHE